MNLLNKKELFIVMVIMIAGITQENIYYNHNPFFLISFLILTHQNIEISKYNKNQMNLNLQI